MADFTPQHALAVRMVGAKGAAVTFSLASPGTYDEETGTYSDAVTTTVVGNAIRTRGDPIRYEALGLVQSEAPHLVFAPTTYGEQPALQSTVTWNGVVYTVRDVEPVEPDGNAIICKVIVAR